MATRRCKTTKMGFEALEQTNQKLQSNPDLSRHNKEVLDEFFRKLKSQAVGEPTIRDYASRFNSLASHIDFKLDEPEKKDLESIIAALNTDKIRKNNGEKYKDHSKEKFWSTLSRFYRGFIKKEGKGFSENIDGEDLLEDLEVNTNIQVDIDSDSKPSPEQVKKVAKEANSLRDEAVIMFGWATGARVGEIFQTQHDDEPLLWKDLEFDESELWVKLDGKTGEREIPVRTSMPLMKHLWETTDSSLDDPVFNKKNQTHICPRCSEEVDLQGTKKAYLDREYECTGCGWEGTTTEVDKRRKPLTDDAVRRIIERTAEKADIEGIDLNPHDFFRKSRAIYRASTGWSEYQLRAFFGWSENSDAPKHYITLVKEDLKKALRKEYGEELDEDERFDEDALKPVKCASCGHVNSATWDLCRECNQDLTGTGMELSKTTEEEVEMQEEVMLDIAEESGIPPESFREVVRNRLQKMEEEM